MAWSDGLTGEGLAIAGSTAKRLRVMAGPGTGKSFAMKRRICRLIEEGADPGKILAVTFTRTAAADLKRELHGLGVTDAEKIYAMTLHSFCFAILQEKQIIDSLGRVARPVKYFTSRGSPQFELSPVLKDLDQVGDFGNKREKFQRIKAFEAGWARRQNESLWIKAEVDRKFHVALMAWLKDHSAMFIGELIPLATSYLENNPASDIFRRFEYVVVDEYQDLNKCEQTLLDLLALYGGLSVVGDVDQSIYSFRCAHPGGIAEFIARHSTTEDRKLDECRRCSKKIVSIADSLILNNHPDATGNRLLPVLGNADGDVKLVQWQSAADEAAGIAGYIGGLIKRGSYAAGDFLVLSPRRRLGYSKCSGPPKNPKKNLASRSYP